MVANSTVDDEGSVEGSMASILESDAFDVNDGKHTYHAEERATLARKETKAVSAVRLVIFFVLLAATCAICLMVYFFTRADEKEEFESQFADYAGKVIDSYTTSIERQLGAVDSLSVSYTSVAKLTGAMFPKVTLPDFAIRGAGSRIMSDATVVTYAPVVTDENREAWEAYAVQNQDWAVEEDAAERVFRTEQDQKFGVEWNYFERKKPIVATQIVNVLKNRSQVVAPAGSGPYLPGWQFSPVEKASMAFINVNLMTHPQFKMVMKKTIDSGLAVFNRAKYVFNTTQYSSFLRNGQYRYEEVEYAGDPTSNLIYPVFDRFGRNKTVAGFLFINIYFNLYLMNVLPSKARGVICVLENSLNQTFTYRLDGSDVIFLGEGDQHDNRYDHLALSQDINEYLRQQAAPDTSSYTVVDLDDDFCRYKLSVYPSAATEEAFMSDEPMLGSVIVAVVFVVTSLVFVLYDFLVERRQNVVMDSAAASGAIVSSLFPKNVKERLMEETDATKTLNKQNLDTRSKEWIPTDDSNPMAVIEEIRDKQIADLYPATTILFADLAGFTAWSSKRTPQDVFVLLETIYNAFDTIAEKRGVYKIETIGDCYVAVTGLPEPQEDHAVRMVKFASNSMTKMNEITHFLMDTLGEDTGELQMRVGLHSGAVTAGVLRGQKSRFQLFGDTMNTASRMESNGVKGRIHVSQATADELVARGKSRWITPREDKIVAKGKGEMQTYFVEVQSEKLSSRMTMSTDQSFTNHSVAGK